MNDGEGQTGRLVAVVVTHRRLDKLKVTVTRLLAEPPEHLAALVCVDNASGDGTAEWLRGLDDSRLVIEETARNIGGAGGFERGMRLAVERFDPDWTVVMDDDARPEPGALAAFHAQDMATWDAAAAAVYYPSGEICEMNRPSRNPFWHGRVFLKSLFRLGGRSGFHIDPAAYRGGPRQVDIASFVGLFLSRAAIARAGFPDPALFVYGDDGIYTLGLSRQGGRIAFLPAVRFEHDCSTFAGQRGRFRPLWKVYYYHRNLLILYRAAAGWMFWPLLGVVLPKWLAKVRHHSGERGRFLRLLGLAIRHGLLRRTGQDHARISTLADSDR